ncbi:MAG TPA: alkaline phosphatase family protein [Steroidobacteraceae bacterium]|nr:alkaline phosphatase family protein [Steroidobacteraceae bacterium]
MRHLAGALAAALVVGVAAAPALRAGPGLGQRPPSRIRHVFLIMLENESFGTSFGTDSPAPYLARTLPSQGLLLTHYYAIGHNSLGNYIALVSGQAPNEDTQGDCLRYTDFAPARPRIDEHGQALGRGCVYPRSVRSLPDQLEAAGLTWKGYMEDMGKDPARERRTCGHGVLGEPDPLEFATRDDQYASKHDPFIYFHSIIDDRARCDAHVVPLDDLAHDLRTAQTTPNYVFITPNLCHDGHDGPCVDGEPGRLVSSDEFLRKWVPLITGSPAFRRDGLLIVTFDESSALGRDMAEACCNEQPLPGARFPPGLVGPGGGRIGAVAVSPFIEPGTTSDVPCNHYSLLATVEAIFGLPPLGYAADRELNLLPILRRPGATAPPSAARASSR